MSKITKEEVAKHKSWKDGNKDVWCIFENKVYNVSSFLDEHPGGEEVLLDHAGGDMTQAFHDIGHSDYAKQVMNGLLVGDLDVDSPAPVAAEPKKTEAAKAAPAAAPAKPREASAASTLLLPIGVILVSVLVYMYYGRW